jgi:putative nucleotidyltransferase with HDIG domain
VLRGLCAGQDALRRELHQMNSVLKKIGIEDVRVGMYLEDVFNAQDVLLLSANVSVLSHEQIEHLKNQGVTSVFINTEKGADIREPAVEAGSLRAEKGENEAAVPVREAEYFKELEKAKEVHRESIQTARVALEAIRKNQKFSVQKIERAAEGIVESILRNPDALVSLSQIKGYDEYTYVHSVNVGVLVTALANALGYSRERLVQVGTGGLLHDVGKMRVPERILNKPGKYTDEEFNVMKKHPLLGLEIANQKKGISDISKAIIIEHHERFNGQGYPHGLKGEQIREVGLISAVADVYDALTSDRIYRAAWPPQKALGLIFQGCDIEYSRYIVERFTKHLGIYPVGSFVQLVSGELGVVTQLNRDNLLTPKVLILFDELGQRMKEPVEYVLSARQQQDDGEKYKIVISMDPKAYQVDISQYITSPI